MDALRAPLVAEAWETSFVLTPTGPDTFSITVYEDHEELMPGAIRWNSPYRNGLPVQDEIAEYRLSAGGQT